MMLSNVQSCSQQSSHSVAEVWEDSDEEIHFFFVFTIGCLQTILNNYWGYKQIIQLTMAN